MQLERHQNTQDSQPNTAPESFDDQLSRWSFELGLAAGFLPEDPLNALEWASRIEREIASEIPRRPEAEASLRALRGQVLTLRDRSRALSRRFLAGSERREHAFEAGEHAVFDRPLRSLRKPWPAQ